MVKTSKQSLQWASSAIAARMEHKGNNADSSEQWKPQRAKGIWPRINCRTTELSQSSATPVASSSGHRTIFSQIKSKNSLVERAQLFTGHFGFVNAGGYKLVPPPQSTVQKTLHQVRGRNQISIGNNSRIFGSGCSKKDTMGTGKTSYSMVCNKREKNCG